MVLQSSDTDLHFHSQGTRAALLRMITSARITNVKTLFQSYECEMAFHFILHFPDC